jgi:hypothetical protein
VLTRGAPPRPPQPGGAPGPDRGNGRRGSWFAVSGFVLVAVFAGVAALLLMRSPAVSGSPGSTPSTGVHAASSPTLAAKPSPAATTGAPSISATGPATTTTGNPATAAPAASPAPHSTTGTWSQQAGSLILTITQVDIQDGVLQLHMKAVNNSAAEMDLPLYGYFVAIDNSGASYQADSFAAGWNTSVPANESITGTINLIGLPPASAQPLSVSFTTVFGQYAPNQGITIKNIPIPH